MWYHKRLNAPGHNRTQLTIKPDFKETCQTIKQCHFSHSFLLFLKSFLIIIFILNYSGFIILNKYFTFLSFNGNMVKN